MAKIGMKHPVYAPVSSGGEGSAMVYGAGAVLCHAISADVTINRRDNPLYGDDMKIENDKGVTDYSIAFVGDDVPNAARVAMLGEVAVQQSSAVTHYEINDDNPPYVGFGYYRVLMVDNVKIFEGFWYHKVQFAIDNENATSKNEQIDWGTYNLTGTGFGVETDNTGTIHMFDRMQFSTEAAALAWVNGRAGISS